MAGAGAEHTHGTIVVISENSENADCRTLTMNPSWVWRDTHWRVLILGTILLGFVSDQRLILGGRLMCAKERPFVIFLRQKLGSYLTSLILNGPYKLIF